jgi:hypothetical protein
VNRQKKRLLLYSPYPAEKDHLLLPIFNQAVQAGKELGRPFEEHEVLEEAWIDRYGLRLNMDPCFHAVQAQTATQPRLWIVLEPVYLDQKALLGLAYQWYRCTSVVRAARAVFGACLLTMDGLEEFTAGDYVGFDEQWKTWELRRFEGKTFLDRFTLQESLGEMDGWSLYKHSTPYRIARVSTRFTLHSQTALMLSEMDGGYVRWNGEQGETASFDLLSAFTMQHYYHLLKDAVRGTLSVGSNQPV